MKFGRFATDSLRLTAKESRDFELVILERPRVVLWLRLQSRTLGEILRSHRRAHTRHIRSGRRCGRLDRRRGGLFGGLVGLAAETGCGQTIDQGRALAFWRRLRLGQTTGSGQALLGNERQILDPRHAGSADGLFRLRRNKRGRRGIRLGGRC